MKNTLKYFLLIALGFIALYACQQDDFQGHSVYNHENTDRFKRKKVSLEDIENKEVIQKKIETLFSKNSFLKYKTTSTINQLHYFLETDEIVYIEDGITHSYTIPMLNLDNPSGLVNLLLSSENGEEYDMYIVEYNINEEEQLRLMTGERVDLENKFTFTRTDEVEISFQNKTTIGSTDGCSTITYVPGVCASGQHQYGDMSCEYLQEPVQIDKIAPPFQNIIISYTEDCGGGGVPSPGESETNPNPTNPTNPGSGTGGYTPNPSNTTPNIMSYYSKFLNFYLLGKQEIQDWLEDPQNSEEKESIKNFLNNMQFIIGSSSVEEQINEKYEFANLAIDALKEGGKVDFNKKIIYLVNKPCQNQILQDVISTNSPFTNLIRDIFGNDAPASIRFSNGVLPDGNAATSPEFYGTQENYIISVKFDNDYLDNATNLSITASALHELVHAHLMYLFLNDQLVAQNSSYQSLMDAFLNFYKDRDEMTFNELDNEMHNAMSDYIQKMANSIYNYAQSNNNPNVSVDYCIALAWSTMQGYDLFNDILTNQQQQNYSQIGYDEQNNTGNKKGNSCP